MIEREFCHSEGTKAVSFSHNNFSFVVESLLSLSLVSQIQFSLCLRRNVQPGLAQAVDDVVGQSWVDIKFFQFATSVLCVGGV